MKFPSLILLACNLTLVAQQVRVQVDPLPATVIHQRLELAPEKLADRRAAIESLFRESGCDGDALTTLKVPHSAQPDVICTLAAEDPAAPAFVVGGHFDYIAIGRGAVDDWSGASLLPSLYQSLKTRPRHYRFVFIAFAGEENGLNGSTEYVRRLTKEERSQIKGMINLECLGLTPVKVWSSRADKRLLAAYLAVARAMGVAAVGSNVENVGDDDSHPFLNAHIPVLTMHSITQENIAILHTSRDQVRAIHSDDYYQAYRVAATLLGYLDTQ